MNRISNVSTKTGSTPAPRHLPYSPPRCPLLGTRTSAWPFPGVFPAPPSPGRDWPPLTTSCSGSELKALSPATGRTPPPFTCGTFFFEIEPLCPDVLAGSLAPCQTCTGAGDMGSVHCGQWMLECDRAWLLEGPQGQGLDSRGRSSPHRARHVRVGRGPCVGAAG